MTIVSANWVGENTTTVGTGPLALSGAISKFCPFSVLPDGSEVYYTLQEGANRETGIGVVSNGTLTRNVQATLAAGVYTETNIPISLIGNGQVFAVINADFMTRIYNFSLDVADSVAAAAASAQAAADSATAAAGSAANSLNSANSASSFAADASSSATVAINAFMNSTFEPSDFDFASGGTLDSTDRNKAVYNLADNNWYSWAGTLPHVVSPGTYPTADSNWKPRTDQLLRQDLASTTLPGGSLVSLDIGNVSQAVKWVTPEMFGAVGDGVTDDTVAVKAAIAEAKTKKIKVALQKLYAISENIEVPDDVSIFGSGHQSGFILNTAPSTQVRMLYINSKNVILRDFSLYFKTGGLGAISDIKAYGVFVDSAATGCILDNLNINGMYNESTMGFSNGVRVTGKHNKVNSCRIEYCSMGITARGEDLTISNNYCNNHFVDQNYQAWNNSLPWWDGIACEGLIKSKVTGNTCEYNGQSGFYFGGGAALSLSYDNVVAYNRSYFNTNHGIDCGVGTVTATADLYKFVIIGNISRNNRYNQIWLGSVHHIAVTGNDCDMDADHANVFGVTGDSSGIALRQTTHHCTIAGNNVTVTSGQYASIYIRGTNHTVGVNTVEGKDMVLENVLASNNLTISGAYTPTLISGTSSAITITSALGHYEIKGNRASYFIDVTLSGVGGTGAVTFSPPPFSGSTISQYDGRCTFDSGMSSEFYTGKYGLNVYYGASGITVAVKGATGNSVDAGTFLTASTRLRIRVDAFISNPSWIGFYN